MRRFSSTFEWRETGVPLHRPAQTISVALVVKTGQTVDPDRLANPDIPLPETAAGW